MQPDSNIVHRTGTANRIKVSSFLEREALWLTNRRLAATCIIPDTRRVPGRASSYDFGRIRHGLVRRPHESWLRHRTCEASLPQRMEEDMIARIAGVLFFIVFIQGCSTLSEGRGAPVSSPGMNYERHCSSSVPLEPLDADASQMSSERMASLRGQFTLTSF